MGIKPPITWGVNLPSNGDQLLQKRGSSARRGPHFNANVAFQLKRGPRVQRKTQTLDANLSNSASHVGLSNLASYFKWGSEEPHVLHGFEQLHVSRLARV